MQEGHSDRAVLRLKGPRRAGEGEEDGHERWLQKYRKLQKRGCWWPCLGEHLGGWGQGQGTQHSRQQA